MWISNDCALRITNVGQALIAAMVGLAVLAGASARSNANELLVKFDQSQILKLARPVSEIIIGNPMIADVAIQSSNMLVATGKSFGMTNIIALDQDRNVIVDTRVLVQRDNARMLNLTKAGKRETYNCTPQCNPSITVGDDKEYFEQIARTSDRKIKMIEGQTDGGSIGVSQ